MKRLNLIIFLLTVIIAASAQVGNEWINFGAAYYKIPIGKDGVYRLTRPQLIAAGVPSFIDPKTIKIYHRGTEQAIYVEGESDSQLNTNDFVEFFGRKNDGTLDKGLYLSESDQPHQLYNLYSDTTAYFLTYGGNPGKRSTSNALTSSNLPEIFHWDEKLVVFNTEYSKGLDYGEIQVSGFDTGEGWTSAPIFQGQSSDFVISGITSTVPGAGAPKVEIVFTGRGPQTHEIAVSAGGRSVGNISVTAFSSKKFESTLEWSDFSGDQLTIRVAVSGTSGTPARASVGYIKVTYPQSVTLGGSSEKYFTLNENPANVSVVEIPSPPSTSIVYDVTDPSNVQRLPFTSGATLNFVVSQTSQKRRIFVAESVHTPTIKRVSFRQFSASAQDYVIITHPSLRKPVAGYTDPVKALGEYRSLPEGGGYDTLIVNIDQLYNQFNYGEVSPLAIFKFLKFLKTGKIPAYLFLIGKGLNVDYAYYRNPHLFTQYKDLVPTAGLPASDMKYSAGLSGIANVPAIATGRLSATGPADVAAYFNKLKEFEQQPFNDLRRKNILHLSGGLYAGEPQQYRTYLEEFAGIARSFYLGGNVKAIAKRSTDIEVINIADELNRGLNLITLFGHSSPVTSDFDIGMVTDPLMGYSNKGKYPTLLLNGCLAGSYFLNGSILGENWTNTPDRGAIGVIAHSSYGFPTYLKIYSNYFYKVGLGDSLYINKGIGDVQKEVARRFLADYGSNFVSESQVQQMVLVGDPAVSLFGATKPDFAIVPNSVSLASTDGSRLNAFSDSLALQFVINNYGRAKKRNITINVQRTLNDNSVVSYDSLIPATLYSDTISFLLPGRIDEGFGNNNFKITVESEDEVDELNEENNTYSQVFFIPLSGTKNLYPDAYAIVNSREPRLSFQHTDLLADKRKFIVQLDTVKDFSSGFFKEFTVEGQVLASQQVALSSKDSVVYYWRTKLAEPLPNENINWETSSFIYINNGQTGWAQTRFGQFEDNFTEGLEKDSQSKRIEFKETVTSIDVTAFGAGRTEKSSVKINGAEYNLFSEGNNFFCRDNTINLIAFDKTTTQPYAGVYFSWVEIRDIFAGAAILCGREPYVINSFKSNELAMGKSGDLIQYIDNIAEGDSVLLFTMGNAGFSTWPSEAKTKLSLLGISSAQINELQDGEPVVIFARKGAASGSAIVHRTNVAPASAESLTVNGTVTGRESEGLMTTQLIGPAREWNDFTVKYRTDNPGELVAFNVFGVDLHEKSTLLFENLTTGKDLSSVDASLYPYLKITFSTKDETFVTAAELAKWLVTYEPVAEGLLLYKGTREPQTVSEGEKWSSSYSFINISDKNFVDSLTVRYDIQQAGSAQVTREQLRIVAPLPGDTTIFQVAFPTRHQVGINDLTVNVNPRVQAEKYFDNNFITLPQHLNVIPDTLAPLLEVTFDGRFISNEEYVSPTPEIQIKVIDNNPHLLISDTTSVKVFLQYPCAEGSCTFSPIYFSSNELTWSIESATSEFQVTFKPNLEVDGLYVLRVIAKDASENFSGAKPYEISFQVSHTNSVIFSDPYPNPFNNATTFEIAVSGETIPDHIQLTIFNTRGEVIRTFSNEEFGNLHIGVNQFRWEALGENGNPIPNGLYIFRTSVQLNGQVAEKVGKLMLVR